MHGVQKPSLAFYLEPACENPQVHSVGVPYWFLLDEGGTMTPATYEEMADTSDVYLKVSARGASHGEHGRMELLLMRRLSRAPEWCMGCLR